MAIQYATSCIKNKAINNIIRVLENPSDYCWQEETWESKKLCDIENIIDRMKKEIKNVHEKYKNKEAQ